MSRFKLFIPFAIFVVLAFFLWFALRSGIDPHVLPSSLVDKSVPSFEMGTVNDLNDTKTQADIKSEEYALINVWATWCGPCRQEHPFLIELSQQGVPIYGVNSNDELEPARQWLSQRGDPYQFSVYDPGGALAVDLGTTAYPESFLVDSKGVIRHSIRGVVNAQVWKDQFQPVIDEIKKSP